VLAIDALKDNDIKRFSMKNSLGKIFNGHATSLISQDVLSQLYMPDNITYLTESI
jgi:processive 1,2-diacylglycerol beta-glucosyltransferase